MKKIKLNSKIKSVAIYGANLSGYAFKHFLESNYPKVKIEYFIDFNAQNSNKFEEIEVISPEDFIKKENKPDMTIIAPYRQSANIELILRSYGISNLLVLEKDFEAKYVAGFLKNKKEKLLFTKLYLALKEGSKNLDFINNIDINTHGESSSRQYLDFIKKDKIKNALDCGGLNGYTSLVFEKEFKNVENIFCFEPLYDDFKDYIQCLDKKSTLYSEIIEKSGKIRIIKKGVWDKAETLKFFKNIKNPTASSANIRAQKENLYEQEIQAISIDDFRDENKLKIDFIKMDIEGAELKALMGAKKTIREDRPQLAISIYHSLSDFIKIPCYLKSICKNCTFHFGHYSKTQCESVFYAV